MSLIIADQNTITLLGLQELLIGARICLEFKKESSIWQSGGCLGFPCIILLTCFIDSIGRLLLKAEESSPIVDNFKILCMSEYFNNPLSSKEKDFFYNKTRKYTLHRSSLRVNAALHVNFESNHIVEYVPVHAVKAKSINLPALLSACEELLTKQGDELFR